MRSPIFLSLAAVTVLGAACGNYSTDDIDFQLAVPQREELSTRMPGQALVRPDAAEYYRATRDVSTLFNMVVVELIGLVDTVRATPPSARNGDERVWGPFRHRADGNWEVRLRMSRDFSAGEPSFRYVFEVHRVGLAAGPWELLLSGTFGLHRGHGEMILDLTQARKSGYPVAEFKDLQRLVLRYQRRRTPIELEMTVENVAESPNPGSSYRYLENADGSGELTFSSRRQNLAVQAVEVRSRWNPTGAGRADARITEGTYAMGNSLLIDCWDADGRATYVLREYGTRREEGSAASCVFGPP
jgi:hypothetical protein